MTKREEIDGLVAFLQGVPLDERRIYMERACSAEPRLRPILQALLNGRSVDEEAVGELSIPSPSELTRSRRGPQWGVRRAPAPTVSHFDLLDELGSGGMGVVYRARDQRLDRYVALKFLPDYLNADDAARERFVNEARAASALDHPNICTVHEIGETEAGRIYIAMAYYDGATLTQSMASGALAVEDAVRYAVQIASGLQAAHDAGIVHRDVKPANVMITDRDQVKILDFGLAKIQDVQLTRSRVAMGTIAYMSPEQTRGEAVDHRTDIWSLGVVLYQMLTGRPPFDAGYQQAVMYQILHEEPETIRSIRDDVSEALEWLVWKMLRKEPGDRYQSISEVLVDLRHANSRGGEGAPTVAPRAHWSTPRLPGPTPVKLRVRALVAAVVALPLVLLSLHLAGNGEKATASVARLALPLPADQFLAVAGSTSYPFDVSPDGTMLVYLGWSRGVTQLFLRRLDEFGPRPLAGTEGARQPFFSPDGAWVGFFAGGQLRKAAVEGGAPMVVGPAHGSPFGAHWGPQGTILFSTVEHGLFRVSAEGGTPDLIAPAFAERPSSASDYEDGPPAPAHRPRWPRFLPDGGHALVSTDAGLHVLSLATGELHYLFAGSQARYVPTGHLLFAEGDNQVRLVPFDPNRRRVTGPPRPALDNVFRGPGSGALAFAVSETGTLVYLTDGLDRSLVYVDRAGQEVPISVRPRGYRFPRVSPDGRYLAVTVDPRPSDIWIVDLVRESADRFTTDGHNIDGSWSPDGRHLLFYKDGAQHLIRWPEGTGLRPLSDEPAPLGRFSPSWTLDGRVLLFENRRGTGRDLVAIRATDGRIDDFLATAADEWAPRVSPDGRLVAFTSNVSGDDEVYVMPLDQSASPRVVSFGGGIDPSWSADNSELFYRSGNAIMSVRVGADHLALGRPTELFSGSYDFTQEHNWGVLPDGRFVMVKADPASMRQFQVVLNWFEELTTPSR